MTSNASPSRCLQRLEPRAGRQRILAEPQSESAQSLVGDSLFDDLQLGFGQPGIASLLGRQRYRQRRLAEHRGQHAVVHRGREREPPAPALADHPDALARCLLVEVAGQRPQVVGDRPVGVRRERREFLCHTTAQHDRHRTRPHPRCTRRAVQRRACDGESVVHQMITERQHAGMDARHLRYQHHAGTLALAIDVVGIARGA